MDAASDAELVTRCRSGDQAAWNALVDRYARYVYAIATRVYRLGPEDSEDVFQEVFTWFGEAATWAGSNGIPTLAANVGRTSSRAAATAGIPMVGQ